MVFKPCLVPTCTNDNNNTPHKLFLSVPNNPDRRKMWYEALDLDPTKGLVRTFVCEDHFNLEDDVTNWMYFKTCGKILIPKKDVVPHLNLKARTTPVSASSQWTESAKNMKESWLKLFGPNGKTTTISGSISSDQLAEAVTEVYLKNTPSSPPSRTNTNYRKKCATVAENGTTGNNKANKRAKNSTGDQKAVTNVSRSSQTSTKRRRICAVENCTSTSWTQEHSDLTFHFFPRPNKFYIKLKNDSGEIEEIDKAKAWEIATNVKTANPAETMICSLHFKEDDYTWIISTRNISPKERKILKTDTVPSCNLPKKDVDFLNDETLPAMDRSEFARRVRTPATTDHFVDLKPSLNRTFDDLELYSCRHQCQFTTSLKMVLQKHEQFNHNPGLGWSTGSSAFRLPTFTCLSCRKCSTFSAVVMSKHDCLVDGSK